MENDGFLKSKTIGRSRVYQLKRSFITDTITSYLQDKSVMKRIETRIKKEIKKLNPVSFVLFGSSLYSLKPGKDIDFLLIYENKPPENIYEISSKLTEEFGLRREEADGFLRKAEEFYDSALENYQKGRYNASIFDSSQSVILANDAFCIFMLGKRPSKIIEKLSGYI